MLKLKLSRLQNNPCPRVLGINEHFFTRKEGYATTLCDLAKHRVHDVFLGRSELPLQGPFQGLFDKLKVKLVVMDLSETYRRISRRFFPNAKIVADRFHVVRLVNYHFLKVWQQLDPSGRKNRGLLSLMRQHTHNLKPEQTLKLQNYFSGIPALGITWDFKQALCSLLFQKSRTKQQCKKLIPRLLGRIRQLKASPFESLKTLGSTLESWDKEIVRMWGFLKTNGITEGFHNKMELISRRAYGSRNFKNYRLRVKALCS